MNCHFIRMLKKVRKVVQGLFEGILDERKGASFIGGKLFGAPTIKILHGLKSDKKLKNNYLKQIILNKLTQNCGIKNCEFSARLSAHDRRSSSQ